VEDVALHRHSRQLGSQTADLHLLSRHCSLAGHSLQRSGSMRLHPVGKILLHHAQAASRPRQTLAGFHKSYRFRLNSSVNRPRFPFLIVVSLSLLNQLAKGYALREQGQCKAQDAGISGVGFLNCRG